MACHVFEEVDNIVLVYETHLAVNLRELWLAVGTQIFVPKTLGNLEVTVETAHHKQLFKRLWTLWKGVELPRIHARRHNEIACALGCRTNKYRCFHLDKVFAVEEISYKDSHLVAQLQVLTHIGTAQVEVTILHSDVVAAVGVLLYGERWRFAFAKHIELRCNNLNVASGKVGVLALAFVHRARHLYAKFAPQSIGAVAKFLVFVLVEHELGNAISIAKVDERHSAHLPNSLNPPCQRYRFTCIG